MRKTVMNKIVVLAIISSIIFGCTNVYASIENENASDYNPFIYVYICQYGDQNLDVSFLQECLYDLGYYYGSIDGSFGNMTYNAVCNYQNAKNLSVDGVCGPATWRAILTTYVLTFRIGAMASLADEYYCLMDEESGEPGVFFLKVGSNDYVTVRYAIW